MTRTFDDPEAISRLLEEKEKDLELTVQIGKELLAQNNQLESRVSELEAELSKTSENLQQLTHDLQQKNELINVLTNDLDDGSETSEYLSLFLKFQSINIFFLYSDTHWCPLDKRGYTTTQSVTTRNRK